MKTIAAVLMFISCLSCVQINIGSSVTNVNAPDYILGDENIIEGSELKDNRLSQKSNADLKSM